MTLADLQSRVHVAKNKRNEFGGYNYRTAEGILAAAKAALPEGAFITVTDDIREVAGQIFVQSTARVWFPDAGDYTATGFAMHPLTKKGMDPSQITGSASSYARKYALGGLLALDDGSVDPDSAKEPYQPAPREQEQDEPPAPAPDWPALRDRLIAAVNGKTSATDLSHLLSHKATQASFDDLAKAKPPMAAEVRGAILSAWSRAHGGQDAPPHPFVDRLADAPTREPA